MNNVIAYLSNVCAPQKEYARHTDITTPKEQGIYYSAKLSRPSKVYIYGVDNGLCNCRSNGIKACDHLIAMLPEPDCIKGCFVELKSGNRADAIKQLETTLKWARQVNNPLKKVPLVARFVCGRMPANAANRDYKMAKEKFYKLYNCSLDSVRPKQVDVLDI